MGKEKLNMLKGQRDNASLVELKEAGNEFQSVVVAQQEAQQKQRSKTFFWLKEGDCNSRAFHATTTVQKKVSTINKLKNSIRDWCDKELETGLHGLFHQFVHVQWG